MQRTRPGILLAYNFLTGQMERTITKSVRDGFKVVMYLKRSRGCGLRYQKVEDQRILFSWTQHTPVTTTLRVIPEPYSAIVSASSGSEKILPQWHT